MAVGDYEERELLKPVAPFERNHHAPWVQTGGLVLSGDAPQRANITWARELGFYPIPGELAGILRIRPNEEIIANLTARCFHEELSQANHLDYFATLLWIEEDRMT